MGAPKYITPDEAEQMRRLRYEEHLTCREIGKRFGVSGQCVSEYTKPPKPKPTDSLRERWALMLPDMLAAMREAARPKSPYPHARKLLDDARKRIAG